MNEAEMRMGAGAKTGLWQGALLPDNVKETLGERFGIQTLCDRNLLSSDGNYMALRVLAGALPDSIINAYFKFDPQQRAQDAGIDFERFKTGLRAAFKGTIGKPGTADFGILLDRSAVDGSRQEYSQVLGLAAFVQPYGKDVVDNLAATDLPDAMRTCVSQGRQVNERGIDASTVYLITPERSPFSVQVMARILNFQGASHCLPTEQKL